MANRDDVKFELHGGNWNRLNSMLNNSPELHNLLEDGAKRIHNKAVSLIRSTGSSWSEWVEDKSRVELAPSRGGVGIDMYFVSIPNSGFEMKHGVLKGGLDASRSS